jgi:MerR family transcriptional regulator, light-induced transcriptional regulator
MDSSPQGRLFERSDRNAGHSECLDDAEDFRAANDADAHFAQLARAIEQEIIPRLMLAHRQNAEPVPRMAPKPAAVTEADVQHFAKLVLHPDEEMALSFIAALCARGVPIDAIYLDLLAPTARHFGRLWEEDLCDFSDVTIGLGRLQRVLRELSPSFGRAVGHPDSGRRILLLPSPGEQHTFGLVMVSEFFRRAGWDVSGGAWMVGADAPSMVASEWFDVIGFSMGAEIHLQALADCIRETRRAARNRALAIMVGGPLFAVHPEFVGQVGADGMTIDGQQAPALAESLIVQCGVHR